MALRYRLSGASTRLSRPRHASTCTWFVVGCAAPQRCATKDDRRRGSNAMFRPLCYRDFCNPFGVEGDLDCNRGRLLLQRPPANIWNPIGILGCDARETPGL